MSARPSRSESGPPLQHHVTRSRAMHPIKRGKSAGAHGFFEVTGDVSDWTCADFLSARGRRTPVMARFSTIASDRADSVRDHRGFAVKFFTDGGVYDLVGSSAPVGCLRDARKVADHERALRRSNDAQWDFWTLSPESAHHVAMLMSDRGVPRTLRHMHGYGRHTYSWINGAGRCFWVKYHFRSVQGIVNFSPLEAEAMAVADPDWHRRDLSTAVAVGDCPEWRLEVQIMPFEDAADYRFNPFDATKVWPHADYPPIVVGRMVLDRNPVDRIAEVERARLSPANLVPGIGLSPDRMLMELVSAYHDTETGELGRYAYERHAGDDDFAQARSLYRDVMDDTARQRLASNIAAHASDGVSLGAQRRVIGYWEHVDAGLGARVAAAMARV